MLLLVFGLVQAVVCKELLDIVSIHGFVNKAAAQVGTPVEFEGPLRVGKKQHSPVELTFESEIDDQIFGIFPSSNVSSGRKFGLFVKDPTLLPTSDSVNVTLVASDAKNAKQQIQLVVHLEDGQLEAPELDALEYNLHVSEFKSPGILKKFKIRNGQRTRIDKFVYKLSGEHSELFSVDAVDPDQILFSKVGCKECANLPDVFPLLLNVYSNTSNVLPAKTLFVIYKATSEQKKVSLKDPIFNFTLKENSLHFDKLARVETSDGSTESIFFQIEPTSDYFDINQRNGVLSVRKPAARQELGNETTLTVQLRSIDHQNQILDVGTIRIQIEKSDKLPLGKSLRFEQRIYAFALTPGQVQVGRVSVLHPMDMIRYRIVEGGEAEIEVDGKNGQLTYKGPQITQSKNYTLKMIAIAGDQTDLTSVQILVAGLGSTPSNFAVNFEMLELNMDNTTTFSNIFAFQAKDVDSDAKLEYRLIGVECIDFFGQAGKECRKNVEFQSNGSLSLVSSKSLAELTSIQVTVGCNDTQHPIESEATAQLLIRFRRNKPTLAKQATVQFESTIPPQLQLPRDLIPGAYVQTVSVKPVARRFRSQQNVRFALDVESERYFEIEPITGIIITKESLTETPSRLNISVTATNLVASNKNVLNLSVQILDTRKEAPAFADEFVDFFLADGAQPGTVVGLVRVTSGFKGGQIVYKMVEEGSISSLFNVSKNGKISLTSTVSSASFGSRQLNFFVSATNSASGMSAILPVHVHLTESENDELQFTQANYSLKLVENAPVGTFVYKFQIQPKFGDRQQKLPTFTIVSENDQASRLASLLTIDQNGMMRTSGMFHQMSGVYVFEIVASNSNRNGTAHLSLEVLSTQSCQPKFVESQSTVIYLNSTVSTSSTLGRFIAETQKECELLYELDSPFLSIDRKSGEVKVKSSSQFENTQQRYPLVVKAKSGTQVARLSAELRVDSNRRKMLLENRLHYQLNENSKADTTVGLLVTEPGLNAKFRLVDSTNDFVVNATTGRLKTKRPLDREQKDRHRLTVEVVNSATTKQIDLAQILVDVLDVNDNSPKFQSDQFEVVLEKRAVPGQVVFKTKAVDPDGGEANKLVYKLESQTYHHGKNKVNSNAFEIADPTSGEIILQKAVHDVGGMFELVITVSDLAEDLAHISRTGIKIWICDPSDIGKFIFEQNARDLNYVNVAKYLHDLETILQIRPIFKGAKFHMTKTGPNSNAVILEILFVNPRTQKIIPFARVEKQLANSELNGIKTLDSESAAEFLEQQVVEEEDSNVNSASLLIAALVFFILLCVIVIVFLTIVYSHKRRFRRHLRICENMKAIADSTNTRVPSHFNDSSVYKTIGETKVNLMLLKEIESSAASAYGINPTFSGDSSLTTRQHSLDLR